MAKNFKEAVKREEEAEIIDVELAEPFDESGKIGF